MKLIIDADVIESKSKSAKNDQEKFEEYINSAYAVYQELNSSWESSAKETFTKEMEIFFGNLVCLNKQARAINNYINKYAVNYKAYNEDYADENITIN